MPSRYKQAICVSLVALGLVSWRSTLSAQALVTQYLAFQLFTDVRESAELRSAFPPPARDTAGTVAELVNAIGRVGDSTRKLAFVVGPLSFDHGDDQVRNVIRDSFAVALEKNVAVGFHIDDSMFWGRLGYLNTPENLEWLDWNQTVNTGRRVDWSSTPLQIMPQLCINSPAVQDEVRMRAALIGEAVKQGLDMLQAANKPELFAGVIAGWETQIGRDFATGSHLGYCALTNMGFSAENPPADMNEARANATQEFVELWTHSLSDAGVPEARIFSHTAFLARAVFDSVQSSRPGYFPASYIEAVNFAPPRVSFGSRHYAGFTTYPQLGALSEIHGEREKNSNPPWASAEGAAIDAAAADRGSAGESMEAYLGNLFNHGAVLVNIFGWGVGDANNPFRRAAENASAIAAYQKFLRGDGLSEVSVEQAAEEVARKPPNENTPSHGPTFDFFSKLQRLQSRLPAYFSSHGPGEVGALFERLGRQMDAKRFTEAEATVDALLKIVEK